MWILKILKHYEKLAHSQQWNKTTCKKLQLLSPINDFEQVFLMETAMQQ